MKSDHIILIGGGALIAIVIISKRKDDFFHDNNEEFREGFTAGFFTPGPFTIIALAGLLALR
jgi:hypothetical protein